MQNRGLYVAAGLFVLALGAFYVYDKGIGGNPAGAGPTASPVVLASPVVGLDPNQLQSVTVKAKGQVLTVSRSASGYNYSLCPDGQANCAAQPADNTLAAQLFTGVVQLRPGRTVYGVSDQLPSFGLDKPSAGEIIIKTASGQTVTLWIGGKAPDNISDYVRKPEGSDIYAIPAASIDGPILGLIDNPPVLRPSPSAQPPAQSPAASPAAPGPAGPPAPSP